MRRVSKVSRSREIAIAVVGAGKNSQAEKELSSALAQLIRPDLMCGTRTNLPINHCAEMLTQTLSNKTKLLTIILVR